MALVVETTSNISGSDSLSITVDAPVGITEGDLLVIAVCAGGNVGDGENVAFTSTGFSEGYRKQYDPGGGTSLSSVALLYKLATAGDESETEYTITTVARRMGGAAMFRISGWSVGNPVYQSAGGGLYQDGTTTVADTVSFQRLGQQLLIMVGFTITTSGDGGSFSFGSYQITSSDSNPTWTELKDATVDMYSGSTDGRFFVAYAVTSDTSTITQYGFVKTGDGSDGAETTAYLLGVLYAPVNATVSNSLLEATPVTFSPLTGSTQEPNNDFHEVSPEFPTQSGVAVVHTVWTPITKS